MTKMSKQSSSSSSSLLLLLLLLLCLGLFVCASKASEQEPPAEEHKQPELPVVRFDFQGHKISVPVFEDVSGFSQVRLDFDKKTITESIDIAHELLRNLIKKKKNVLIASGPAIGKILKVARRQQTDYKKLSREDRMPFLKPEFNKEMSKLMMNILSSKYEGEKLSDDQIYDRATLLMDSVRQVPQHSPTGLYVDWAKLEVDGEKLNVYSAPVIEWFNRSSGRRFCLNGIKSIAAFVEKI